MSGIPRQEIVRRLQAQSASGTPVVGCGAGTGISAKLAEAGGADLIIIYNSGRYRMAGRGSLAGMMPYGDANGIVVDMASEVLPVVKDTPVLAGGAAPDHSAGACSCASEGDRVLRGRNLPPVGRSTASSAQLGRPPAWVTQGDRGDPAGARD